MAGFLRIKNDRFRRRFLRKRKKVVRFAKRAAPYAAGAALAGALGYGAFYYPLATAIGAPVAGQLGQFAMSEYEFARRPRINTVRASRSSSRSSYSRSRAIRRPYRDNPSTRVRGTSSGLPRSSWSAPRPQYQNYTF